MLLATEVEEFSTQTIERATLATLPEVQTLLKFISGIGWLNLLIGMPSVFLVLTLQSPMLFITGLASLLTFWLLKMIVRYARTLANWSELCLVALCGVYCPAFIVSLCLSNLVEAILR